MIKKFLSKLFSRPAPETKTSEDTYEQIAAEIGRKLATPMARNTRLDGRSVTSQPLALAMNAPYHRKPKTVEQAKVALDRAQADMLEAQLRRAYGYEQET